MTDVNGTEKKEEEYFLPFFVLASFVNITFSDESLSLHRISRGKFHKYQNFLHLSSIFWSSFCEQIQPIQNNCKAFVTDLNRRRSKSDRLVESNPLRCCHQRHFVSEVLTFVLINQNWLRIILVGRKVCVCTNYLLVFAMHWQLWRQIEFSSDCNHNIISLHFDVRDDEISQQLNASFASTHV